MWNEIYIKVLNLELKTTGTSYKEKKGQNKEIKKNWKELKNFDICSA